MGFGRITNAFRDAVSPVVTVRDQAVGIIKPVVGTSNYNATTGAVNKVVENPYAAYATAYFTGGFSGLSAGGALTGMEAAPGAFNLSTTPDIATPGTPVAGGVPGQVFNGTYRDNTLRAMLSYFGAQLPPMLAGILDAFGIGDLVNNLFETDGGGTSGADGNSRTGSAGLNGKIAGFPAWLVIVGAGVTALLVLVLLLRRKG